MSNAHPGGTGQALSKDSGSEQQTRYSTPARKTSTTRRPALLAEPVKIAEWWKTRSGVSIRVYLAAFEQYNLIYVQNWRTDKDGVMRPGRGFAAPVKHLEQLAAALNKALARARELGLIADDGDEQ